MARPILLAVGDGSIAVQFAHLYLAGFYGKVKMSQGGQAIEIQSVPLREVPEDLRHNRGGVQTG